ncbi:MAG: aminotransferase class V-fold PLP-dependent enzyme [Ruminococcus sp.]|nr:aminotransferase class V-fold PLP-dependent enzyme [Ruminococcus sp.]
MIYFDNSATTFPKPAGVLRGVMDGIREYGGNPGRSGHRISLKTAEKVYSVRSVIGSFFKAEAENVIFTLNATHALNMAIKGIMENGGHIIISSLEHNSVSRPVIALADNKKCDYSIARVFPDDKSTIKEFEKLIRPDTKCICCTVASNVTGQILPYREIGRICREKGICFIGDCAQGAGVLPITLDEGFNFICTAGHKGLYGPTGTGLLISDGKFTLKTIIEGGTGATSGELTQTEFLPERLESGTINVCGIIGLGKGIEFIQKAGIDKIFSHESLLCNRFMKRLSSDKNIKLYRSGENFVPIVAFNLKNQHSQQVASALSDIGFALRGGLQCAAVAHSYLGTTEQGVVRFSPSFFNNTNQVDWLCDAILKISKGTKV